MLCVGRLFFRQARRSSLPELTVLGQLGCPLRGYGVVPSLTERS